MASAASPKRLGRFLPLLVGADRLVLGLGRQLEVEVLEAEVAQQVEHEAQKRVELGAHLLAGAEDVGVVLRHAPHPGEAVDDARTSRSGRPCRTRTPAAAAHGRSAGGSCR